jgi:flavin-dependent dehydrogenase
MVMTDVLVIGGGPAGASIATRLAATGREVVLLERSKGPVDKVCGEFLSSEAVASLTSLGLDPRALGAVAIETVRLCVGDRVTSIPLPFHAISLSRRVLDEALLDRAATAGATIRRGMKVNALSRAGAVWTARIANGVEIAGRNVFLATGKHDLRSHRRPSDARNDLVAFKLHWRLTPKQMAELDGHVELVLFQAGYAGLQLIESGRANLGLVVRRRRLHALGNRWDRLLEAIRSESPLLDARLGGAVPCSMRPLALSAIPYGYVLDHADGLWRLGDQAAVIPSFTGDGMSIALYSADLAASTYLRGGTATEYQERLAHDVGHQVRMSMILSRGLLLRPGQLALSRAARMWPRLMVGIASHTRIPDRALARLKWGHS